jgi:formamidopyrimidine-DNA glycosylase
VDRPRRQAGRLTREELKRLLSALVKVLKKAIKLGGSSVSDYVDADGVADGLYARWAELTEKAG